MYRKGGKKQIMFKDLPLTEAQKKIEGLKTKETYYYVISKQV